MMYLSFLILVSKLHPFMVQRNPAKAYSNGPMLPSVYLACTLQYFAGGASYNIATPFGVAPSKVLEIVWDIVDTINNFHGFRIDFPLSHGKQYKIALAFENKSHANFEPCVGAVDGILIWIHQLSKGCCIEASCDTGKFFSRQKLKYERHRQTIYSADEQFLDHSILYLGSTADCLAFEGMCIY